MVPISGFIFYSVLCFYCRVSFGEVSLKTGGISAEVVGIVLFIDRHGIAAKPAVSINAMLLECLLIVRL